MNLKFLILKNQIKLKQMINNNEDYKKILYQSKRLDKYIVKDFKIMNQINL